MANTLTGLIPTIYEALDVVSREMIGFIPAVSRNTSGERAALNQTITVPIAPATSLADNTAAVTAPNTGDQTVGSTSMTISRSKHAPIRWNGEEQRGLINAGSYAGILQGQFVQAFRALTNQVDADLCGLYKDIYNEVYESTGFVNPATYAVVGKAMQRMDENRVAWRNLI